METWFIDLLGFLRDPNFLELGFWSPVAMSTKRFLPLGSDAISTSKKRSKLPFTVGSKIPKEALLQEMEIQREERQLISNSFKQALLDRMEIRRKWIEREEIERQKEAVLQKMEIQREEIDRLKDDDDDDMDDFEGLSETGW